MTVPVSPSRGRILFFLVLTTFFWGGSFLFTKIGARDLPPGLFVLLRFSLASLLMLLLCLPRLKRLDRKTVLRGAIVGMALGATNLTFVVGIKGTSISRAGILNNLFVLFIPLIAKAFWRERIGMFNGAGILLACSGIALLAAGGGDGFNRGDMISTLCAFFIAVHIITVSKVLKDEDVWLVSLVQFTVVAAMAGTTVLLQQPSGITVGREALQAIVYCAIFPTVVCFTLQNTYQRFVTPTQAGLIYTLDPVWSLLAGFIVLGERLSPREWLGCGLIFLAVLIPLLLRFLREQQARRRYLGNGCPP